MNARGGLAAMVPMMVSWRPGSATVGLDDHGGEIGAYLAKYHALRISGERVVIDGICASACTMLLGAIPGMDLRHIAGNTFVSCRLECHTGRQLGGEQRRQPATVVELPARRAPVD